MKTVAVLIYAERHDELEEIYRGEADSCPPDEYSFSFFFNPDLDEAWKEAGGDFDYYIWLHGAVTLTEGSLFSLLDNSSFLADRAVIVGTVRDSKGRAVSGGFGWNKKILQPDPVIPAPCRLLDGLVALIPACVYRSIGILGGRYRGQLAGFDYAIRAKKAGYPCVIAPGTVATCEVRPNPDRTVREEYILDLRSKGFLRATWALLRASFRHLIIKRMSLYE